MKTNLVTEQGVRSNHHRADSSVPERLEARMLSQILGTHGLFAWKIRCVDAATKQMFDRFLVFDPPETAEREQVEAALNLLNESQSSHKLPTIRQMFRESNEAELAELQQGAVRGRCLTVDDYFEDQHGNPFNELGLVSLLSGQEEPIIFGNARSVLRLGPAAIKEGEGASIEDSNNLAHFIQAMGVIQRGAWWRTETSLSSVDGVLAPGLESTVAALALIRQLLLRRDDTFRLAAKTYMRLVDDERKRIWVETELSAFDQRLRSEPFGTPEHKFGGLNCEQIVDLFVYGTGLFHRQSNERLEHQLSDLTQKYDQSRLVFSFHAACRELLTHPFRVSPIINQDMANWTETGLCPRPTRVVAEALLRPTMPATTPNESTRTATKFSLGWRHA